MSKMKTRLRRMNYRLRHDYLAVENVVLVLAVLLCLVWTYQSITAMSRNWDLTERLATEKKALELAKIEVSAAELENDYYRTEEYQELMARKYMDKQAAGEKMVVMPENSEEAKNKHKVQNVQEKQEEKDYTNFERWMMYLFPNY